MGLQQYKKKVKATWSIKNAVVTYLQRWIQTLTLNKQTSKDKKNGQWWAVFLWGFFVQQNEVVLKKARYS